MAEDPYPLLRAQLEADLAIVEQESRGLKDLAATSVSQAMLDETVTPIAERDERATLIHNVLRDMDLVIDAMLALEADGWPAPVPKEELSPDLTTELKGQADDLTAGILVFTPEGSPATGGRIDFGEPVPKPKE